MGQKIGELNPAETAWINDNIAAARAAITASGYPLADDEIVGPAALDAAWAVWLGQWKEGEEDPNPAINQFGHAFGQYLVERLGMVWKMVDDEYGTDAAVVREPGNIVIVPANLVAKRFESRTSPFFASLAAGIGEQVTRVSSAASRGGGGGLGRLFKRKDGQG
jgi:hypothetical protein